MACGKQEPPDRQVRMTKHGFLHFILPLINLAGLFHREIVPHSRQFRGRPLFTMDSLLLAIKPISKNVIAFKMQWQLRFVIIFKTKISANRKIQKQISIKNCELHFDLTLLYFPNIIMNFNIQCSKIFISRSNNKTSKNLNFTNAVSSVKSSVQLPKP